MTQRIILWPLGRFLSFSLRFLSYAGQSFIFTELVSWSGGCGWREEQDLWASCLDKCFTRSIIITGGTTKRQQLNLILVIFNCECACVCKCDIPIHLGTCSFLFLLKSIQGYVNICNIQENGTKKESSFLVVPFSASSTSLHSATFQVCCCRWWWWSSSLKCGWLVNFHQLKFLPSSTFHGEYNIGIVLGIIYSFSHQPFTIITRLRLWPCHVMCLLHLIVFWPRHSIMHIILHHCHQNVQHAGRHRHHRNNHDHSPKKNLRNFTQVARKVFAERSNCIKFRILEVFNVPQGNVFPIVITIDVHVYYYHLYNSFYASFQPPKTAPSWS